MSERLTRHLLFAAFAVVAAGCASLESKPPAAATKNVPPASAAASANVQPVTKKTPQAKGAAGAQSAPDKLAADNAADKAEAEQAAADAAAAEKKAALPEISPAVQRAFDTARSALNAGRLDEAERGFLALTRSNPELSGPHANLGILYRQAGKLPEAIAAFEQAVRINPQNAATFNQLGIAHRLQGQFDKARDAYEKAVALDSNYAAPQLNLGILHDLYFWDTQRALEHYDRYLSLTPTGDDRVKKWVADIKNRKQSRSMVSRREQQ